MAFVTVTTADTQRYLLPSLPELEIQIETETPLPQLPQEYISRYMWHETQMRGSIHLHEIIWANHQIGSEHKDFPEPCPEPPCLSDSAVNILENTIYALDLPDLVSENSTVEL